jgi:hypothetical protein
VDPRFESKPGEAEIAEALAMWPEVAGRRIRPLFISAFGDIYVEASEGDIFVASPLNLSCNRIASSVQEFEALFLDGAWASENLRTELALLADERGVVRAPHQVFAVAPHPCLAGRINIKGLMPMDLKIWHHVSLQQRGIGPPREGGTGVEARKQPGFVSRLLGRSK